MFGINLENFNYKLFFRTRRYLVMAIGAAILSIVILLFILIPQVQRVFALYQDLNLKKESIIKLRQKALALDSIETDPIYQNQIKINRILPSRKAVFELLASLKFIGDAGSVKLRDIDLNPGLLATESAQPTAQVKPSGKQKIPGVEQLVIELRVEGTRGNINRFLSRVSQIIPLTSVTQMKLRATQGKTLNFDTNDFSSEVELTTYYFSSSIAVSADSPLPEIGSEEMKVLGQLGTFLSPQFIRPQDITGGGLIDLFGEDALQVGD